MNAEQLMQQDTVSRQKIVDKLSVCLMRKSALHFGEILTE